MGIPNLNSWHFEASEDIMTKFKSQGLQRIHFCPEFKNSSKGPFNNYVDKMRGGGGHKMAKFCPRSC